MTLGLVLLLSPHLGDPAAPEGAFFFLMLGPVVVFALWSAAAAAVGRSFRAGVRAALWGTALGTPLMFLGGVLATVTWVETGSRAFLRRRTRPDGRGVPRRVPLAAAGGAAARPAVRRDRRTPGADRPHAAAYLRLSFT
ncbi:hypothetical protein E1286_02305 [Nonomuraea terrae]|uniref:Uncharacterized protein n=1 Tax=Nonomuraea terrae TaxID=2530383 RepID=A0A4R4ZDF1_9ACTN|nr:hypothetical protein [Nonomuraea terrae]TDD56478.1 hypothetical protein E1286_02305 [Nonomuraea terrae]